MPSYKLIYFDARGRAETARIIFKLAGVEFEDKRIVLEEWADFKSKTPFGMLPFLEVDGKQLSESKAIYRYLAREFGFYGSNNWENSQVDSILDMLEDLHQYVGKLYTCEDPDERDKLLHQYRTTVEKTLRNLEKKLKLNHNGDGYFVGDKITVADIGLFCDITLVNTMTGGDDSTKDFPKLLALYERVGREKNIADWVAVRPDTLI